jgi:hypothetical protein
MSFRTDGMMDGYLKGESAVEFGWVPGGGGGASRNTTFKLCGNN